MKQTRCEEVVVQLIVRDYDAQGRPTGERISQPVKVFRSQTADFWAGVDSTVSAMVQVPAEGDPLPAAPGRKRKAR